MSYEETGSLADREINSFNTTLTFQIINQYRDKTLYKFANKYASSVLVFRLRLNAVIALITSYHFNCKYRDARNKAAVRDAR